MKFHVAFVFLLFPLVAGASEVLIELEQPDLDANPYHRPYVAVWVETLDQQPVKTIALWADDSEWHKDLRRWWRSIGRYAQQEIDGVTSATRRPGKHKLSWDGKDALGHSLPIGDYFLLFEAAREEGGRSYQKQLISLGEANESRISSDRELGEIIIKANSKEKL